jgi:phage-related protein (TIGR01555 family)
MSGRIVNVRPKPGFLMDGAGEVIPARQNVVAFSRDRLTNAMSGMGTTADKRVFSRYLFVPLSGEEAEAGYRSSWLVRKIIDVPPFDMTREWRDWQAEAADIDKLEAEEKRLQLKVKCQRALVLSRLFGGSGLILGTNDADPTQPLRPESVKGGGLTYVHVMSRWQLSEGQQRLDPTDPWFGQPDFFTINTSQGQQIKLHPSRVVAFIGQKAPEGGFYQSQSWFWGDSIMQSIGEAVKNADLAQSGFAALIDEAKIDILKIPDLMAITATDAGTQQVLNRLSAANLGKSSWRALMLDAEEDWQQKQVTWAGIPDIISAYLNVVAGAADIPVTRLLGQSPKGLQSTGDGEERDYHSMLKARQNELLAPALDRIDELLLRSALGSVPTDIYYEFAPLRDMDEKDAATIEGQFATALKARSDTGMFQEEVLAKAELNRMLESGRYPGLETAIDEAANEGVADPNDQANQDPNQLLTREQQVAALAQQGTITPAQKDALLTDAQPRSLYVSRKLLNGAEFIKWAKGQGFATTVPADELHVTVLFSRTPVDWMKMGSGWDQDAAGKLKVAPGGARLVEKLGDKGAVVLLFASSALSWRHEEMVRNGASHDFDEYQPHCTITYEGSDLDLSKVEPYRGELVFGPELFAEVVDDWEQSLVEA